MTRAPAAPPDAAAVVTRGDGVDAWHAAAVAVVDSDGRVTHAFGDPELVTFTRSSIKPLQALPLCLTGAREALSREALSREALSREALSREALSIDEEELALASASHDGGDRQRDVAARVLAKAGVGAERLLCGAHWPIGMRVAGRHPCAGEDRDPLRHNCSGKHAGFLALARVLGVPPERYLDPDGAVQRAVKRAVADACELDEAGLRTGTDGCSAPNFAMPLASLARGFKNLATRGPEGTQTPTPLDAALARVRGAMQAHPELVSGEGRFDYELARAFGARVVSKGGAEALMAIGFSDPPLGIAVKVLDGGERALAPICMAVLGELGVVDAAARAALAHRVRPAIANYQGIETGAIVTALTLARDNDGNDDD